MNGTEILNFRISCLPFLTSSGSNYTERQHSVPQKLPTFAKSKYHPIVVGVTLGTLFKRANLVCPSQDNPAQPTREGPQKQCIPKIFEKEIMVIPA